MKSSRSYNKALFLSLSVIVLVASGCERQGRAPIKSISAGPASVLPANTAATNTVKAPTTGSTTNATTTNSNGTTSTTTSSTNSSSTPDSEAQLILDAQMSCKTAEVDDTASPSKANFIADVALENSFEDCMVASGLKLTLDNPNTSRDWSLDSSPTPSANPSAALTAFLALAKVSGSDDVKAQTIMKARVQLSALRLGKMLTKYSDDRMKSADFAVTDIVTIVDPATGKGNDDKVSDVLSDFTKSIAALNAGLADIAKMQSVANGGMTTTEVDSRNQNSQTVQK